MPPDNLQDLVDAAEFARSSVDYEERELQTAYNSLDAAERKLERATADVQAAQQSLENATSDIERCKTNVTTAQEAARAAAAAVEEARPHEAEPTPPENATADAGVAQADANPNL